MRLNVGCGPHYASGWVNVDVEESDEHDIHPDVLMEVGEPLPFPDDTFDKAYAGHVLEHIPWPDCPAFVAELVRVVRPGGKLCIVGPDSVRTLERWKRGEEPDWLVEAVLEDDRAFMTEGQWEGARHQWNCHEARVKLLLDKLGHTDNRPLAMSDPMNFRGWPVVAFSLWQFGIEVTL